MCSIVYEGINILGLDYIVNNGIKRAGWFFTNFPGDALITKSTGINYGKWIPCTVLQESQGCTSCSALGVCLSCNSTLGYLYDTATKTCVAAPGYYMASPQPLLCNGSIFGC